MKRLKLVIIMIVLMLNFSSCNKETDLSGMNTNSNEQINPTVQLTNGPEIEETKKTDQNVANALEATFVSVNISKPENGWITYYGILFFFNHGNTTLYKSVNGDSLNNQIFVETEGGNQYPAEIFKTKGISLLANGSPGYRFGYIFPPKTLIASNKAMWLENFTFNISFKIPEKLHPTKLTIMDVFSQTDGFFESIVVNQFFTSEGEMKKYLNIGTQYSTGSLPSSLYFTNGISLEIQPDLIINSESNYCCFNSKEENMDNTKDNSLSNVSFKLLMTGDPSLFDLAYGYKFLFPDGSETSNGIEVGVTGPGQQQENLLCFYVLDNEMNIIKSVQEDPTSNRRFFLSVYGEGVDQLLLIPKKP
jgi:hypothetical protein